ncbi:MAG: thiamine pyrophosphate-dependent dehydrogenase E1 component subunit alpha [Deltaproteobacteria bacterium]|nr:thiamine pyrophosphate-dependent dehydrogenase E1 component subunit alpha [Deltaproteobacteria bacterium]
MLRIRMFEERIVALYPEQEMKCPVHLCIGQEAIASGVCANLEVKDYVFSNHRGHGHAIAKGADFRPLMAEFYGKKTGCSAGKGGSMHIIDLPRGVFGTSAIVGGGIPMGVGAALASSLKRDGRVTIIFFGDGASEEGVFYESFNFAALKKLPVVFVCENNLYATNSPQTARHSTCRIADSAAVFGSHGACIDGNDAVSVYWSAKKAVEKARAGQGPSLIEALTYRWKGHVGPEADHEKGLRPKDELFEWIKRCPIEGFKKQLLDTGLLNEERIADITTSIKVEIDDAIEFAKMSQYPSPEDLLKNVYFTPDGGI